MKSISFSSLAGAVILALALTASLLMPPDSLSSFIDIPSIFIILAPTSAILLYNYGGLFPRFLLASVKTLFLKVDAPQPQFAEIARHGIAVSLFCGAFGAISGLIALLAHMPISDGSSIIPGTAVASLPLFYSILFAGFVFLPLERKFAKGSYEREGFLDASIGAALIVFLIALAVLICAFFEVMASWNQKSELNLPDFMRSVISQTKVAPSEDNSTQSKMEGEASPPVANAQKHANDSR